MNHDNLIYFIRQFFGQGNILTIPVPMIRLMGGEPEGALFLSQLVYWSDKSSKKDGWFWKSYAEWESEIFLSEYKVKKYSEVLKKKGVLETKVMKVNGTPTVNYRVSLESLFKWIAEENNVEAISSMPEKPKREFLVTGREEESWTDEQWNKFWTPDPPDPAMAKLSRSVLQETNTWAKQYKSLDGAPDWCRRVSFILYKSTGFEPPKTGKNKLWIATIQQLWSAANQMESVLIAGLKEGEKARRERGLTMAGPRSYMNFCKNQAALLEQGKLETDTLNSDRTQRVKSKNGRTVVEVE